MPTKNKNPSKETGAEKAPNSAFIFPAKDAKTPRAATSKKPSKKKVVKKAPESPFMVPTSGGKAPMEVNPKGRSTPQLPTL